MQSKFGFLKMNLEEFKEWLAKQHVARTILKIQQHHTFLPSYIHFNGTNHFERQRAMANHQILTNGWNNIGQHFTIFPDGTILTGRSLELTPACIFGQNANAICIENFGNFDLGKDMMTRLQESAIVQVTSLLCNKFNIPINTNHIVYHHWFNLSNGIRNNGTKNNKSCPGASFFSGNKVEDCQQYFLPLISKKITNNLKKDRSDILEYVIVNVKTLNVRVGPSIKSPKVEKKLSIPYGSILRVYRKKNGWLKVSKSQSRWVSSTYTKPLKKATVTADKLNVRSGPDIRFPKVQSLFEKEIVFVSQTQGNWCQLELDELWVSNTYLNFD